MDIQNTIDIFIVVKNLFILSSDAMAIYLLYKEYHKDKNKDE
jgi:hypothetical protein